MLDNRELIKAIDVYLGEILQFKLLNYQKIFSSFLSIIKGFKPSDFVGKKLKLNGVKLISSNPMKIYSWDEFYAQSNVILSNSSNLNFEHKVIETDIYFLYETFTLSVKDILDNISPPVNTITSKDLKINFNSFLQEFLEAIVNKYFELNTYILVKMLENANININGKTFGTDGTGWITLTNSNWSSATVDPLSDIYDKIVSLINHNHFTRNVTTSKPVIIMGRTAWNLFRSNPHINDKMIRLDISSYQEMLKIDEMLSENIVYHPLDIGGNRINVYVLQGKIQDPSNGNEVDLWNPNRVLILRPLDNNIIMAMGVPPMVDLDSNLVITKDIYKLEQAMPMFPSSTSLTYRFISGIAGVISEPSMGGTFTVS
ncbi:MAG: major capsid protein [Spirochaetia bacterium]|nr:major capsid protein [Spirochaetota bacterium]MDW8113271.1 major capsid protein [Spirochaetia bacterium]